MSKENATEAGSLLHLSKKDIMMQFGVPDADYRSISAYIRKERIMILVYGLEKRQGRLEETVQGYALGTFGDGAAYVEEIRLFDDERHADSLSERMTFEQLCQQYTVVDVGSGVYRPAMVGRKLSLWLIKLGQDGKILALQKLELRPVQISAEEADAIYGEVLKMK